MRGRPGLAGMGVAAALGALAAGCGARFDLPTETPQANVIPGDKSYQMVATWSGMAGVQDILLTQGSGTQLFVLFNRGGSGLAPRGEVLSYARLRPTGAPTPIDGIAFPTLFNPIALAAGGNRVFVLDAGDSCLAKTDPLTPGVCNPTFADSGRRVVHFGATWRVREYGLLGGDTISTFTDTTVAAVQGIAADAAGNVYVSGTATILVPDQNDPRLLTRTLQYRVYRYARGPRYPGVDPPDRNMPRANWHRDTTWMVEEGSGVGTVSDPRGLFWSGAGGPALYLSDFGKNWIQKLSDSEPSTGFYQLDGNQSGESFNGPLDVTVDLQGYVYVADQGRQRVVRYGPDQLYIQRVDVEADANGNPLADPVAVAADDSLVYVADRGAAQVLRYKRRP